MPEASQQLPASVAPPSPGAAPVPTPYEAPVTPAPSTTTPSPASPAASPPGPTPSVTPGAPGGGSEYTDLLEVIRRQNPQLADRFTDGGSAVQHLLSAYEQAQRWQQFQPHIAQFQEWRSRQEQEARDEREKAAKERFFKAPEYDPAWASGIERDPTTGELRARPGYPPDLPQKYLAAMQHSRGFLEKLSFDPEGTLLPWLQKVIPQMVGPLLQQGVGSYAEQNYASDFVRQNRDWLYDPQGQLTQHGRVFAESVRQAEQLGIRDVQAQQSYATKMVQHAYAMEQWRKINQPPPAAPPAPADPKALFLQQAQQPAAPPSHPGAARTPGQPVPGQPLPQGGDTKNRLTRLAMQRAREAGLNVDGVLIPG